MTSLRPYLGYRQTRLNWLGEIPAQWEVRRNGMLFAERRETGFPELPILEVSLRTGVSVRDFDGSKRKQMMADLAGYKRARQGDIAYNMMRMWQGAVGVAPVDGLISPAYVIARPFEGTNTRYYSYLFRTDAYMGEVDNASHGIVKDRNRLYWDDFKQIASPFPPPAEQEAIVRFLDRHGRLVNRFIRAKRRLIELLIEQKQAIIHQAVTRGLDPNVPLKPSGVAWLGDIPAHWEVKQLKHLIRTGTSITYGIVQAGPDVECGIPYIRTSDMKGKELPLTGYLRTTPAIDSAYRRSKVEPGDLVVAIRATLGKGLIVPDFLKGANLTQGTARISPGQFLNSRFLYFAFNSHYCQLNVRARGKGTTFIEITLDSLRRIELAVPPVNEQEQIVNHLETSIPPVDAAIKRSEQEIDLVGEYRTRLIADVVTGKLDVRGTATGLPATGDEEINIPFQRDGFLGGDGDELCEDLDNAEELMADAAD